MQNPEILHGANAAQEYELPSFELPFQPPVLPVDLYLAIEKHNNPYSMNEISAEMENIHNKAIFDGLNEALDGLRPYGLRGPPVAWSKQGKTLTFKYGNVEAIDDLLLESKRKVIEWTLVGAGAVQPEGSNELIKAEIERIREEQLLKILSTEIDEADKVWLDYEMEET
jgi:hypothetical protein